MTGSVRRNIAILFILCGLASGGAVICSTIAAPNDTTPPIGAGVDSSGFDTSLQPGTATDVARINQGIIYPTPTSGREGSP
jgi:hypothetical protein